MNNQESDDELLDRLIYEASCNNEYDNRDRLHTAREALKKRLADRDPSIAASGSTLLSEIMDLYPYLNCVCGRNKPRVPDSLRDSVQSFLKNQPKLKNNRAV